MSKTRVSMIGPCMGVGGGDALMLGLVKHCTNIEVTGIYTSNHLEYRHMDWARKACALPPIHAYQYNVEQMVDGVYYHEKHSYAIHEAVKDSDIIFLWCVPQLDQNYSVLSDIPVINYAQNCDKHAKWCIDTTRADYFAACSVTAAKVLPDVYGKTVIYNGIDPSRVAPAKGRKRQRELWGLQDKKILLFMGRMVDEKHPELPLLALDHLDDQWVAVFVGNGYKDTQLYQLAQTLYPDRVFFVEPQYQVGDILAAADVFILPSDFEGHSLALCEAWLAGVPTVYTDFAAAVEMEDVHGSLGTMIARGSTPRQVADAVVVASSESDGVLAKVGLARETVWSNYTLPTIASYWEEYFDRCLFDWRRKKRNGRIHQTKVRNPDAKV